MSIKVGEEIETVHGEKLTVLNVKTVPTKRKKNKDVQPEYKMYLAESGDHKVWFSESNLKEVTNG